MGEAKRRRENTVPTVYHHTSTLRTNLIWMSGVIQVEGKSEGVFHPRLGQIQTDALSRRALNDFPAVAWFTTRIEVPNVLTRGISLFAVDNVTGERKDLQSTSDAANAIAMNRVALGFAISSIPVTPWVDHRGYSTDEGQELNASAREAGDNPDEWYVSESPVDVLNVSEFWYSPIVMKPRLKRFDPYVNDIRRMVQKCRDTPGAYIPPTWLTIEEATLVARQLGVSVAIP
ncbi:hypothetical protein HNR59_002894 [Aquamicrobium lusatiense]|uniref:Uncharacterized protein n=1 Tax=Aquamicrobium lusatiense TaxID=89772 RepID=A0A7W9S3U7_9HYPH|nr:hypothetical protein [Aquamicrobium lusatiense]MBB6013505.1 hypothetical protein [Aquamicrobium lusatiense]